MRIALCLATSILLCLPSSAQTDCQANAAPCAAKSSSKKDLNTARKEYERGQKLEREGKLLEAFEALSRAASLAPNEAEYASRRELVRQSLVARFLQTGNSLMTSGKQVEAMAEFRQALELDPKNEFVLQRLNDSMPASASVAAPAMSPTLTMVSQSQPVVLSPNAETHDFHFRGFSRNLLEQIAARYGMKAMFDESVTSRPVRFDIEGVDFFEAMREASKLSKVFWIPIAPKQLVFVNDTQALRRELEQMVTRTFYVSDATTPQELNDVVNLMRTIFEIRFVVAQPSNNSVIVRAPGATLDAAAKVLDTFLSPRPQVNLEVQVFQISRRMTKQIGISIPSTFQVINIGSAALELLDQGNIQDLINQLIASGGINQGNSEAIQALLAQVQGQQTSTISQLLKTPFATFGGGKTLFAVTIPPASVSFQLNESDVRSLAKMTLRTSQNNAATMKIGQRYPILNVTFSPVYNTPAIAQAIQTGSYTAPFPSFTYEDLGITLKATPQVLGDDSINLKLEMQIKSLTGQNLNGVPVISNREYAATMSVKNAEPAVVVGLIGESEQKSLTGLPLLGQVPVLRDLTSVRSNEATDDQLLVVITPYVASSPRTIEKGSEVWLPGT